MEIAVITKSRAQSILYEYADSFFDRKKKVLIPCNTCESVPLTYQMLKIPFEMVDADPGTMSLSLDLAEERLSRRREDYQGLHYVGNYGIWQDALTERLRSIKAAYGIRLVFDKCLCIPPEDVTAGSLYADLEVYSTGGRKCVDLQGGGFGITAADSLFQWRSRSFEADADDYKRMKSIMQNTPEQWRQCAHLRWLENRPLEDREQYFSELREKRKSVIAHKRSLNRIYSEIIPEEFQVGEYANDWRFQVRLGNRDEVLGLIFENGLFASNHYRAWGNGAFTDAVFPVAERIRRQILNLFNDFYFSEEQAVQAAEIVREKGKPCINAQ